MIASWILALLLLAVCAIGVYVYTEGFRLNQTDKGYLGDSSGNRLGAGNYIDASGNIVDSSGRRVYGGTSTIVSLCERQKAYCLANPTPNVDCSANFIKCQSTVRQSSSLPPVSRTNVCDTVKAICLSNGNNPIECSANYIKCNKIIGSLTDSSGQSFWEPPNDFGPLYLNKLAGHSSEYTPSETRLWPHETPVAPSPSLTPIVPSDAGTQAQSIWDSTTGITPSLRQNIRDDVKKAVNSSIKELQNEYEVKYVYQ